jgi:hypothetical protein
VRGDRHPWDELVPDVQFDLEHLLGVAESDGDLVGVRERGRDDLHAVVDGGNSIDREPGSDSMASSDHPRRKSEGNKRTEPRDRQ